MKAEYDGLKVVRIPVVSSDIFTQSGCIANVINILQNHVCISETAGSESCLEFTYKRMTEDVLPVEGNITYSDNIFCG